MVRIIAVILKFNLVLKQLINYYFIFLIVKQSQKIYFLPMELLMAIIVLPKSYRSRQTLVLIDQMPIQNF